MVYAVHFNPRRTPQSERADERQVKNSAGGFSFSLDKWKRLERWLILGAEGGSYYAGEREITRENAKTVLECLTEDGARAVRVIAEIPDSGRAPKNEPAIFALALAASSNNHDTRMAALSALPQVCRIGTHLFHFVSYVDQWRGWGSGLRKAVGSWYTSKNPSSLAHQVTKYQQRDGWSHRDLLRLCHVEPTPELAGVLRWVVSGAGGMGAREVAGNEKRQRGSRKYGELGLPEYLEAFEELKTADDARTIALIREHNFTHEMVASERKNSPNVWAALLENMPPTAMIRNLAKMTAVGLLRPMSSSIQLVADRLCDESALRKARVHPIQVLSALMVYRQGHGEKGKLSWTPVPQVIDALDAGFYKSFGALEPSGKRTLLALDVSGSMDGGTIAGVPGLSPRMAAAAMAMVTMRVEKTWHAMAFSHTFVPLEITPRQRLDDVVSTMKRLDFGGTDCALPMLWASGTDTDVDTFLVYTDSQGWAGDTHPHQALSAYRAKSGINARLGVVGMVANHFTIADPTDAGMLDVVGFDTSAPHVLASFSKGE